MIDIYSTEFIIRICIAALLGGVLGFEREIHGRPAGLRTHFLVSLGAAVFMMLSPYVAKMEPEIIGDPGRIAAQIVSGIGFLGAGAIVKEGVSIRGLTTAASLWVAAAIGMTTGVGSYKGAIAVSGLALIALELLPHIETIFKKQSYWVLEVITPLEAGVSNILDTVKKQKVRVLQCDQDRDYENDTLKITLLIRIFHRDVTDKHAHGIVEAIEQLDISLKKIVWRSR
ncbi:MAG TPA: MgtC/SapB family protein [Anaerolineales bacterium]|nr:MgtC/SapB family protein [Anaerolineales bacterium]